ncbi:MAG: GxxExxY protein [Treponema sp.]|nr:GxxExxY protein [Treponema sp.]
MRLSGVPLGFLFNFNVRSFKNGIERIVLNDKDTYSTSATSRFFFFIRICGSRIAALRGVS